jgi:hypothetical protein
MSKKAVEGWIELAEKLEQEIALPMAWAQFDQAIRQYKNLMDGGKDE